MALIRRGGCTYYIKSVRRNGRVTSEYQGAGEVALLMARLDDARRDRRASAAASVRARLERCDAAEAPLVEWARRVDLITHAVLTHAGFHRPSRHSWRRRRKPMSALPSIGTTPRSFSPDETLSILKRARDGDEDALPDLHEAFSADPDLINRFGDTAAAARKKMLRTYYGDNLLAIEATKHWIERTARQLAGESPSPIERLLADRASTCWFAVSMYEVEFAAASTEPMTASQADALQKQIDRAHRRLLTSLKALAAVRRVPVAALQVNIDRVNVEAPAMAEEEPAPDLASLPASHGVGSAN